MRESVFRLTPSAAAACVTVSPSGFTHRSRSTSPGWGGLCIFMARSSVVAFVIDVLGFVVGKTECDPPVPADFHGPDSFPSAL